MTVITVKTRVDTRTDSNGLNVVHFSHAIGVLGGKRIVATWAQHVAAINATKTWVAHTGTGFFGIPQAVADASGNDIFVQFNTICGIKFTDGGARRGFGRGTARSVAGTIVGAFQTTASIALVSIKALAFAGFAIANSLGRTFGIIMSRVVAVRRITP